MASGYMTPMLMTIGISEANHFYNTGDVDVKILVGGAIATALLAGFSNIPSFSQVTTGIAWVALVGSLLIPTKGQPSPAENLLKITGALT